MFHTKPPVWAALIFEKRQVYDMKRFISRELIDKGWSGDSKYCVTDETGQRYLLRISPAERRERVESTFGNMQKVAALGVPMCESLEWGECEEGIYVLQTWINGIDAEEAIAGMPPEKQYAYGRKAGEILCRIHSIPAPPGDHNWEDYFNRKIDRKLALYNECPLKYPDGEKLIDYIEKNRHLPTGRPVTYQHGDYHVGNMMIDCDGRLVIIDFDKDDCGDPWEEFNRIVWCAQTAPAFARGMVDGYFGGDVPEAFWRLLALYIATNTLSSLPWAIPFGQKEVDVMLKQGGDVLRWYHGMTEFVPRWYRER